MIKIEPPVIGDDARRRGPFVRDVPHPERSGLYLYLNTNKLSITLDVTTPTGKGILKELIRRTDIFVEDNPPAFMEEAGLTYEQLERINPRLVMTSITPFGQTGPYRDYRAYQLNSYHAGGEGYILPLFSTFHDREPVKGGGIVGDCVCGLTASLATLTAAYAMNETGEGQHVDCSKQDLMMALVQNHVCANANSGEVHTRHAVEGGLTISPLKCQDGYIMITIVSDREWDSLMRCMGNPAWADERYSTWADRHLHGAEATRSIGKWVAQFRKNDLFEMLQANGVAVVPVTNAEDLARSAQLEQRGFFAEIEHPEAGRQRYPTVPYRLSATPWQAERPAPLLGQHNELVYCERLGYPQQELARLWEEGVI